MLTTLLITSLASLPALVIADDCVVGEGYVKYPVKVHKRGSGHTKRQNDVDLKNQLTGSAYTIQLGIGTPSQPVVVQLDTGSTDLWVNPICSKAEAGSAQTYCESLPRYDYTASSTFTNLGDSYTLRYGKGNATVEWVTDTVSVGSAKLTSQQFGVAVDSNFLPDGILGVGPQTFPDQPSYSFFIDSLAAQGFTNSRAFSLDLRSIDSPDGSVIFGGLDTGKFEGALEKLPIIPASSAPNGNRYWVSLDSMTIRGAGTPLPVSDTPIAVMLDSGSTLMRLPRDIYTALGTQFPTSQYDAASDEYVVNCDVANQAGSVDFKFAGKTIKVAFKDAIWIRNPLTGLCVVGAQPIPAGESPPITILGDSFLRAVYAVFDQDNQNIHLAQAANCGTNLVAIGSGPDAVPSVTGDCGNSPPSSSTSSTSSSSTPAPSSTAPHTYTTPYTTSPVYSASSVHPVSPIYPVNTSHPAPYPTSSAYPISYLNSSIYDPSTTCTTSTANAYPTYDLTAYPTYTTTYTTTRCYTVTACPAYVTDCPVGAYTTETYTFTTTYCSSKPTDTYPGKAIPAPTYPGKPVHAETYVPSATYPVVTYPSLSTSYVTPAASEYPTYATTSAKAVVTAGAGHVVSRTGAGLVAVVAFVAAW